MKQVTYGNGPQSSRQSSVVDVIRQPHIRHKFIQEGLGSQQLSHNITVLPRHAHDKGKWSQHEGTDVLKMQMGKLE